MCWPQDTDPDGESSAMEEDVKVLARADVSQQESLDSEVVPDPMEGEQTWPTEEELMAAEGEKIYLRGYVNEFIVVKEVLLWFKAMVLENVI